MMDAKVLKEGLPVLHIDGSLLIVEAIARNKKVALCNPGKGKFINVNIADLRPFKDVHHYYIKVMWPKGWRFLGQHGYKHRFKDLESIIIDDNGVYRENVGHKVEQYIIDAELDALHHYKSILLIKQFLKTSK